MYKIVFFDVDGTLLSEVDGCMPSSTKEALGKLAAKVWCHLNRVHLGER